MTSIRIPWSLSVAVMVIAAMLIFKRPLGALISKATTNSKQAVSSPGRRDGGPVRVLKPLLRFFAR